MTAPQGWSRTVAALHWLGAAAIVSLLALGLVMTHAEIGAARKFDLYQLHKAIGWLTLVLTLARLTVRAATTAPAPIPTLSPALRAASSLTHAALYALALVVAFSGWLHVSAAVVPIPISLFGVATIPNIAPMDMAFSDAMARLHALASYGLALLIALHVLAALKHAFVDRDETLRRMSLGRGAGRALTRSPPPVP